MKAEFDAESFARFLRNHPSVVGAIVVLFITFGFLWSVRFPPPQ